MPQWLESLRWFKELFEPIQMGVALIGALLTAYVFFKAYIAYRRKHNLNRVVVAHAYVCTFDGGPDTMVMATTPTAALPGYITSIFPNWAQRRKIMKALVNTTPDRPFPILEDADDHAAWVSEMTNFAAPGISPHAPHQLMFAVVEGNEGGFSPLWSKTRVKRVDFPEAVKLYQQFKKGECPLPTSPNQQSGVDAVMEAIRVWFEEGGEIDGRPVVWLRAPYDPIR